MTNMDHKNQVKAKIKELHEEIEFKQFMLKNYEGSLKAIDILLQAKKQTQII